MALGVGKFWFTISMTKEFQSMLHSINAKAQTTQIQLNELKTLFTEFIEAHGIMKQLSVFPFNQEKKTPQSTLVKCDRNLRTPICSCAYQYC